MWGGCFTSRRSPSRRGGMLQGNEQYMRSTKLSLGAPLVRSPPVQIGSSSRSERAAAEEGRRRCLRAGGWRGSHLAPTDVRMKRRPRNIVLIRSLGLRVLKEGRGGLHVRA